MQPKKKPAHTRTTSWGKVAHWYEGHLEGEDTYHAKVVLPNLVRVLNLKAGEAVLDLACGEGYFSRAMAKSGAKVVGADIAPELIAAAKEKDTESAYHVAPATNLRFAKDHSFDAVVCVLALQNIEDLATTFSEVTRVLKPKGRFVMVLNHPVLRVLKRSSWGWDEKEKAQYRRIDGYLSGAKVFIDMAPGGRKAVQTISYHRSLQDFTKLLAAQHFAITKLEEWISHKQSGKGPRQAAEDKARKEIPLFMMLEARQLA